MKMLIIRLLKKVGALMNFAILGGYQDMVRAKIFAFREASWRDVFRRILATPLFQLPVMLGLLFTQLGACANIGLMSAQPAIEVQIVNRSSTNIDNAEAQFGKNVCGWGKVVSKTSKSYMFYPYPITPTVELRWDVNGESHVKVLDVRKILPIQKAGRLSFVIVDGRVEVSYSEEDDDERR